MATPAGQPRREPDQRGGTGAVLLLFVLLLGLGAFGVWSAMLVLTGWLGGPTTRAALLAVLLGVAWAAIDELTQPLFNRHAAWSDWFADVGGVITGTLAGTAIARRRE